VVVVVVLWRWYFEVVVVVVVVAAMVMDVTVAAVVIVVAAVVAAVVGIITDYCWLLTVILSANHFTHTTHTTYLLPGSSCCAVDNGQATLKGAALKRHRVQIREVRMVVNNRPSLLFCVCPPLPRPFILNQPGFIRYMPTIFQPSYSYCCIAALHIIIVIFYLLNPIGRFSTVTFQILVLRAIL
jgi:hypothetical protein